VPRATLVIAPLLMILIVGVTLALDRTHGSSPLDGIWQAHGLVTDATGVTNEPVGQELSRTWTFSERCVQRQCRLWLEREAAGGRSESAPVSRVRGTLHARFRLRTTGCGAPATGTVVRTFDITVAPGAKRLTAHEATRSTFPGCASGGTTDTGTNTLRWIARKRAG
jgi:hypothetical protein